MASFTIGVQQLVLRSQVEVKDLVDRGLGQVFLDHPLLHVLVYQVSLAILFNLPSGGDRLTALLYDTTAKLIIAPRSEVVWCQVLLS